MGPAYGNLERDGMGSNRLTVYPLAGSESLE